MRVFPLHMVNGRASVPVVLLTVYAGIAGVVFYQLAVAWPHASDWKQFVLVLLIPGIAINLLKLFGPRKRVRSRRVLERVLSVIVGVPLALVLSQVSEALAFKRFQDNYAAFVQEVQSQLPAPCVPALAFLDTPEIADYNRNTYFVNRPRVTIYYAPERIVISLPGGSIDIDGSTLYFDSTSAQWQHFHNDDRQARVRFEALVENLEDCLL